MSASNTQVRGVYAANLTAALSLIGRGQVATVYGTLAPHARVIDIDLDESDHGEDGLAVVDQIEAWAAARGIWTLTRPSGGADGRHHLYVLVHDDRGNHLPALESEVDRLRTWYQVPRTAIDLRSAVRPLSAPHRSGVVTSPYGNPTAALRDLRRRLSHASSVTTASHADEQRPANDPEPAQHEDRRTPLAPRPRPKRALPPDWAAYLITGIAPALGGSDHSRSTVEVVCLKHMIRAGYTWRDTLKAIWDAHDDAMTHARGRGLHRLIGIWNRAVLEDHAWTAEHGLTARTTPELSPELAAAIDQANARLEEFVWTLSPRQRPAVLRVGDALNERVARSQERRIPCPERDLVEDTCLDRDTVRTALRCLDKVMGILHTDCLSLSPARRASTSYEFEIYEANTPPHEGVGQNPPPSSHTPLPPPAPGIWSTLPPRAHQLYRALPPQDSPSLPLEDLAPRALATPTPDSSLPNSSYRTLTQTLRALAHAGLAACDEHGRWSRLDVPTLEHREQAARTYSRLVDQHTRERTAYRSGEGTDWRLAQRTALARNHAREQAWWRSLTPGDRARRRDKYRQHYRALPLGEQASVKDDLAARRQRAGIDEDARHQAWLAAWHPDGLAQRRAEHQATYLNLPAPLRAAHAAMWADHRARWTIR